MLPSRSRRGLFLPLFCVLNFLFVGFLYFGYQWPCQILPSQKMTLRRASASIAEFLDTHNVPYIFFEGALLGIVREHDLIPWDNDVDILILEEPPYPRWRAASTHPDLRRYHLVPNEKEFGTIVKIYTDDRYDQSDIWRVLYKRTTIDLMTGAQTFKPGVYQGGNRSTITMWGYPLSVPADPHLALSTLYGPDYMTPDRSNDGGCGFNDFTNDCPIIMPNLIMLFAVLAFFSSIITLHWAPNPNSFLHTILTLVAGLITVILFILVALIVVLEPSAKHAASQSLLRSIRPGH